MCCLCLIPMFICSNRFMVASAVGKRRARPAAPWWHYCVGSYDTSSKLEDVRENKNRREVTQKSRETTGSIQGRQKDRKPKGILAVAETTFTDTHSRSGALEPVFPHRQAH